MTIQLIVGLGNPGPEYEKTRHNAGAWFIEALAHHYHSELRADKKFFGLCGRINIENHDIRLLIPTVYMNLSGQSTQAIAKFYQIKPEAILVCHDELDLDPGIAKLKQGGGLAGHNGLKDIANKIGTKDYLRLRLGIGRPHPKQKGADYVLNRPSIGDRQRIDQAIDDSIFVLPDIINGQLDKAMKTLHTREA